MKDRFDILIRQAQIVDGTGRDSYRSDVGISGGRIDSIGDLSELSGEKELLGQGLLLTPGFIDAHSHADCTLLMYPQAESCVMQGVTTVVGGNCGLSPAPLAEDWLAEFWEFDLWDELCPSVYQLYGGQALQPLDKVRRVFHEKLGYDVDWHSFGDFLRRIEKRGTAVNFAPLVGHGQIRAAVMGGDFAREATSAEEERMGELLREAMDAGAFGFSSGLSYAPGVFAPPSELEALAGIAQSYGGIYATHFNRLDLKTGRGTKIKGIEEAIAIARSTGIKLEISHLYSGYDIETGSSPSQAEELADRTLGVISQAAESGVSVAFDVIPNVDGGVAHMPYLAVLLHAWVKQSGGMEQFLENLKAADYRDGIRDFIEAGKWHMLDVAADPHWDEKTVVIQFKDPAFEGKTVADIAQALRTDSLSAVFTLVAEDPEAKIRQTVPELRGEAVKAFIADPRSMIGSDSFALDLKGPYGSRKPVFAVPHPNTYNAFPHYICSYPQGRVEDTIRKITGFPAQWFGIKNRGLIKEGYQADVVLLDPKTLRPAMDYTQPRQYPSGILYVIVNGQLTVELGRHTGALGGDVLKKTCKGDGKA